MPPPDDRPTALQPTAVQPTAEQPRVTTAPATRRARRWAHRLPARIGRARTSTLVIGCLFVLLFALHLAIEPDPVSYTTVVDANTGARLTVPASLVPGAPTTSKAPSSTARESASSSPTTTGTSATTSRTTPGTTTTTRSTTSSPPTSTAPRTSSTAPEEGGTTSAPRSADEPTPSTAEQTSSAPTS